MNKVAAGIGIGLLLGLVVYFVVTLFLPNEFISKDFARVTVKNESGKNITKITLQHKNGRIEASGLNDTEEMRFVFPNAGENVYHIVVTFEDDLTLASKEIYFEHGYRGVETIRRSAITTTNN